MTLDERERARVEHVIDILHEAVTKLTGTLMPAEPMYGPHPVAMSVESVASLLAENGRLKQELADRDSQDNYEREKEDE